MTVGGGGGFLPFLLESPACLADMFFGGGGVLPRSTYLSLPLSFSFSFLHFLIPFFLLSFLPFSFLSFFSSFFKKQKTFHPKKNFPNQLTAFLILGRVGGGGGRVHSSHTAMLYRTSDLNCSPSGRSLETSIMVFCPSVCRLVVSRCHSRARCQVCCWKRNRSLPNSQNCLAIADSSVPARANSICYLVWYLVD